MLFAEPRCFISQLGEVFTSGDELGALVDDYGWSRGGDRGWFGSCQPVFRGCEERYPEQKPDAGNHCDGCCGDYPGGGGVK